MTSICTWAKAWTAVDRLLIIEKSDVFDKIKHNFFQAAIMSILLCGCFKWMLTVHIEKKLDENCSRMLQAILNKSWKQHPTKQQLYGHLPPISKTIQIRWTRYVGHYWRSKDKLMSDILSSHRHASVFWPTRNLQKLFMDMMVSRRPAGSDGWWEWIARVLEVCASIATWWWWYYLPTPPLGQDMTQGQFLSGVWQVWIQSFPSPRLVA